MMIEADEPASFDRQYYNGGTAKPGVCDQAGGMIEAAMNHRMK